MFPTVPITAAGAAAAGSVTSTAGLTTGQMLMAFGAGFLIGCVAVALVIYIGVKS